MFHEVQFPTNISMGSRGGPGFSTSIIEGDSGASERVSRWPNARRRYNAKYGVRKQDDLGAVIDFYICRQGPAIGWRYKDWGDFTTAANHRNAPSATDITLGTATATTELNWQLRTHYLSGPTEVFRTIEKPVAGTVLVSKNNTPTTSFTVNTSTGLITLASVAIGDVIKIGCEFDVPAQFGSEIDAALQYSIDNWDSGNVVPDIPIVEMVGTTVSPCDYFYGGSTQITNSGNFFIEFGMGRVILYLPTVSAAGTAFLPDPTDLELGGPYFLVLNGSGHTLTLKDYSGTTTIASITTGKSAHMVLYNNGTVNLWKALIGN